MAPAEELNGTNLDESVNQMFNVQVIHDSSRLLENLKLVVFLKVVGVFPVLF